MPRRTAKQSDASKRGSHAEPRFLIVGRIRKPHGVRGDLKVAVQSDDPDRFFDLERVFVSANPKDNAPSEMRVTSVRFHGNDAVLTFDGLTSREAAAQYNSAWLFVAVEDAVALEDGEIYTFQMVGLAVKATDGREIGVVESVLETGANDVIVAKGPFGEVLIPDIPQVVLAVDLESKQMTVELLEGLLPDSAES